MEDVIAGGSEEKAVVELVKINLWNAIVSESVLNFGVREEEFTLLGADEIELFEDFVDVRDGRDGCVIDLD